MEAKDFYFELCRKETDSYFLITPKSYYDKEGCLSDESGIADEALPKGFYELQESMYEYDGTSENGRQLLIDAGMKEISFGLGPGEPSSPGMDEEGEYEEDDEDYREDDLDTLLKDDDQPNAFDYKNISSDKLLRHLNVMVSTDAFEEAAKIRDELNSRGITEF
jgi:hypothetical protein